MNKTEFDNMSFDEAMKSLYCEGIGDITPRENLLECAIDHIKHDNMYMAIHILNGVDAEWVEWYIYDYSMGTLENVTAIDGKKELEEYLYSIGYFD